MSDETKIALLDALEEVARLREVVGAVTAVVSEINGRLDQPVRPYSDPALPISTERAFLRDAYGDELVDDLEAILAKVQHA